MPGFLHNLLVEMRIGFGAKAILTDVENMSPTQGAHLALMLALFRNKMSLVQVTGGSFSVGDIIQHPNAYRKELGMAAYQQLEEIRQASRDNVESYRSFGVSPNPAVMEHIEICDLSLSILMGTVGVACSPSTLETISYAWDHVLKYIPTTEDVDLAMTMPEYIINDVIEQPLETEQWLEISRTAPDFLKPVI